MALIKYEKEIPKVKKNVSLEKDVETDIELYAELLDIDNKSEATNFIINEGLKYFFSRDRDFIKFKESLNNNSTDEE